MTQPTRQPIARLVLGGACLLTLLGGSLFLITARAQQPAPRGKITPWEAIKIATGKVSGRPLNANFEFDEGHWTYGVMIVSGKSIKEVQIDPMTRKVGATEDVTPEGEAREVRQELTAALKAGK